MIKHVVLFKFNPEATQGQKEEVLEALNELPKGMPFIKGFCAGLRCRPRCSYDAGIIVDLEDMEALNAYSPHPAYEALVAKLREIGIVDLNANASLDFEV